ncbi:MAG: DUF4197 domain-containing protein [Novosphingobium sp.]|jgi:hypothetical protein|nr:DUF4197 domain-containing protein [Novosphingobium sp.]
MTGTEYPAIDRRGFLAGGLTAGALLTLPGAVLAQDADTATEAVRRLMALASGKALTRLGQPNGFLTSTVARFGLPVLFVKRGGAPAGPLADVKFREQLIQRLNILAEAGARGAVPVVAEAARRLAIADAPAVLRGKGPTAATSAMRLEMGAGLVNALKAPLERAMTEAQDPIVAQAVAQLPGVAMGDVANAVALSADNGIWYEIGSAEADIRADPAATGDAVLIAALGA